MPVYDHLPSADPVKLPKARRVAAPQVLCLPIYPDLPDVDLGRTIDLIRR